MSSEFRKEIEKGENYVIKYVRYRGKIQKIQTIIDVPGKRKIIFKKSQNQ